MEVAAQTLSEKQEAQRWLFAELAAVLLSSKSGELLNLDYQLLCFSRSEAAEGLRAIAADWDLELELMCSCERAEKWLVYAPERVAAALSEVPREILQEKLGYDADCPRRFVREVSFRWRAARSIPHEVGFALGYPVKDVLGFMGLNALSCSGCCGWCVYGDWQVSAERNKEYRGAKSLAMRILHSNETASAGKECLGAR